MKYGHREREETAGTAVASISNPGWVVELSKVTEEDTPTSRMLLRG